MKKISVILAIICLFCAVTSYAEPDYYFGDANVYTGSAANVPPNIMFLFDVSQSMTTAGTALSFDSTFDYIGEYEDLSGETSDYISGRVYTMNSETSGKFNDTKMTIDSTDTSADEITCSEAATALAANGIWSKAGVELKKGECVSSSKNTTYFTGDNASMQYEYSTVAFAGWVAGTSYSVGDVITVTIDSAAYKFSCTVAGTSGSTEPLWNLTADSFSDGTVTWEPVESALSVAVNVIKNVANLLGDSVILGAAAMGEDANKGATIFQTLIQPDSTADLTTFNTSMETLRDTAFVSGNHQAVNEGLWDVGTYYNGDISDAISSEKNNSYPDPVSYWCQSNNVIVITTNLNEDYVSTKNAGVGDEDSDGVEATSKDVATYLYNKLDPIDGTDNKSYPRRVRTHVIQLFSELADLSDVATNGHGIYHSLDNAEELESILFDLITGLLEEDSSFVAPVVPASPENRVYSGQRIYLGFFKPMNNEPWYGNLKKFGLNSSSQITAFTSSGDEVQATDSDGYFLVDTEDNPLIRSFWGTDLDGGEVNLGGVGQLLMEREDSARTIYTYAGASAGALNELSTNSTAMASLVSELGASDIAEVLDVADTTEAEDLIKFVHGYDAYAVSAIPNRDWIMGDVMHSKPVVVSYNNYTFSTANEADDTKNKSYIFVGANDGMLHAFKDVTGEEAWSFIPQELLTDLQYLDNVDGRHYYYVDSSPVVYMYDADGDGTVETGDKVVLLFGMRRGGGDSTITSGSQGSYIALDITDPEDPRFMWRINRSTTGFGEMGQTWSLPRLTKMQIGSATKIVAVWGAGYDTNEDLRYGDTQTFPDTTDGTTVTSTAASGEGSTTSSGTSGAYSARGRGVYIVEIATLSNGVPNFTNSGAKIWSYSYSDNSDMSFSISSDPFILDRNFDGFTDHIYVGDSGGQLWRFNVADTSTSNWTATLIFEANPGAIYGTADNTNGRKFFYKPTATVSGHDTFLFFGSGDREHPLNLDVIDRFYMVRDRELDPVTYASLNPWDYDSDGALSELNLVDVTEDDLQDSSTSDDDREDLLAQLENPYTLDGDTYYGWYIRLDENIGEKMLALPKVVNGVVFFTTYQPADTSTVTDPCVGVLGPSRLYAVDAFTAEAVYNFDTSNDTTNQQTGDTEEVLRRSDRTLSVGDGIASEPLILINSEGEVSVMVGRGGGFFNSGVIETIDPIFPLYWMKW